MMNGWLQHRWSHADLPGRAPWLGRGSSCSTWRMCCDDETERGCGLRMWAAMSKGYKYKQ